MRIKNLFLKIIGETEISIIAFPEQLSSYREVTDLVYHAIEVLSKGTSNKDITIHITVRLGE